MALSEIVMVAVFVVVVLFGIVDFFWTPIKIKRFYKDRGFDNKGEKKLSECTTARIVDGMYTERYFSEDTPGVSQFKAWSVDRKKFTLSKVARKRNRAAWSVTVVEGDFTQATCLILPTVVPEAIGYVGNGENIDFENDLEIANRYHIVTENEALFEAVITGEIREFLLRAHIVFIEITEGQLVMKRTWADHLVVERLTDELEVVSLLQERLKSQTDNEVSTVETRSV